MSAKDFFHKTVKTSLEKDEWTITDDPLFIQVEDVDFYIDLAAERTLYLAITVDIYDEFFSRKFIQRVIAEHQLKLLIFNPEREEIVLWKE